MPDSPPSNEPPKLACPRCGRELERMVVTSEGVLIGCVECAGRRFPTGPVLSREEWAATHAVGDALAAFGLHEPVAAKAPQRGDLQPRAHIWVVRADASSFVLKRYHPWLAHTAIHYEHSVLAHLAAQHLPVAAPVAINGGTMWTDGAGVRWALFAALPGAPLAEADWMWHVSQAAATLAALHRALQGFTPDGAPHPPWERWTLERLDAALAQWPALPDLTPALVTAARQRLAERYFTDALLELPPTVVHGDFSSTNVLWVGDRVSGVVDFERAHGDAAIVDFGAGIVSYHPPQLRAAVAAYHHARPLTGKERELLPEALLLGALLGIDAQVTVYHDETEANRRAQTLSAMLRNAEALRRAAAPR